MTTTNKTNAKKAEKKPMAQALAEQVAARWSVDFKAGRLPWHQPWAVLFGTTISHRTGKPYSLRNQMLIEYDRGENAPGEYVTFIQCKQEGGQIRKGEHSTTVLFAGEFTPKSAAQEQPAADDDDENEPEKVRFLKGYPVFRVDQCDGIEPKWDWEPPQLHLNADERNPQIDAIINDFCTRNQTRIQHGQQIARCDNGGYLVLMPNWDHFKSGKLYYKTLFHELSHAADIGNEVKSYATNKQVRGISECVADFSACLIMKYLGAESAEILEETNAYMNIWAEEINNTPRLVWKIIGRAERAAMTVLGIGPEDFQPTPRSAAEQEQPEPEQTTEPAKTPVFIATKNKYCEPFPGETLPFKKIPAGALVKLTKAGLTRHDVEIFTGGLFYRAKVKNLYFLEESPAQVWPTLKPEKPQPVTHTQPAPVVQVITANPATSTPRRVQIAAPDAGQMCILID